MKYLQLVCVVFVLPLCACEDLSDLTDFDFSGEDDATPSPSSEGFENDVQDYEDNTKFSSRETMVRQVIVNSMKTPEMKNNMAKVLPILRVMTPDQKLALATLVTTQVLAPATSKGLSLEEVSALFGNNPNTTAELMLPISLDVANLFRRSARSEKGPTAEELRAPPFLRNPGLYRRNIIERPVPVHNKYMRPRKPVKNPAKEPANCELFTANICLKSHDYPIDAIMSSIRRNKYAMGALLTDIRSLGPATDGSTEADPETHQQRNNNNNNSSNDDATNEVRRTGGESGYMCPSIVRYARPQKARATSGQWKYIVNTADHTQTLRLERCLKAGETCTYLTDNYKSRCVQVYNYHRLLTWDQTSGLHMDIFKVPTCCSCHIDSYKVPYPPLLSNHATTSEAFPGEEIESSSTDETIEYSNTIHNHHNHYRKDTPQYFDHEGESTKTRPAVERPNLPKYLEAPKVQENYSHKQTVNHKRSNTPKPFNKRPNRPLRRRQPTKPVRDLAQSEANFSGFSTEVPTTTVMANTKKINYNYHPIIDFFKPDIIESRMDINMGENDWRPVTSMLLATERTFRKR